jgi:cysteine desulfurase
MVDWLERDDLGDPGRMHSEGMAVRVALEGARDDVADALGARPREVIFTSGATESIASVCWGATRERPHMVVVATEHSAVLEWRRSIDSTVVGVGHDGIVEVDALDRAVRPDTGVVHCQWVNHETGVVQPLDTVADRVRDRSLLHVDAAQALAQFEIAFDSHPADLISLSGHKIGGPTGSGVLLVRRRRRLEPLLVGGDQERARRAGMENVAGAVGLAAALRELRGRRDEERTLATQLSQRLISWVDTREDVSLIGSRSSRAPHIVCLGLNGIEPQPVLMGLDARGIAVHSGSSCSSEALEPSPVLAAMGAAADRSLRVSFGWNSTADDLTRLLRSLDEVLASLAALRR